MAPQENLDTESNKRQLKDNLAKLKLELGQRLEAANIDPAPILKYLEPKDRGLTDDSAAAQEQHTGGSRKEQVRQQLSDLMKKAEGTAAEELIREKLEVAIIKLDAPAEKSQPSTPAIVDKQQLVEKARERMRAMGINEDKLPKI